MNEHYKMINDRFDSRAGTLLLNNWVYRAGALVEDNSQMKVSNQAFFRNIKTGKAVSATLVLYADDLIFADQTRS